MSNNSRTKKAAINAVTGSIMQVINVALAFVGRTIFIKLLNSDYLGVNSLYTNILTVLSFAELGIGNAIVFSLYKPIADDDTNKIQALMNFYKRAYIAIGSTIFILGLLIIPFLGYIIKDAPDVKENLIFIYILFLINTSVSYFFSYKKTLITADQKDYVVQIYTRVFQLIQIILQSIFLLITHEYIVYLVVLIVCTILQNAFISYKADQLYPYIRKSHGNRLDKVETKKLFDNVKALFIYKLGSVILNGTDNIIISMLINISTVGIASNYTMLMNNVNNIVAGAINSITASVGNLSVYGGREQIRGVLHQLLLLCVWLYGFISIGFFILANDFICLWLGENWLLDRMVVISIIFSLYINGVQYAAYTFRTTQGLFVQSRWVPMISAIMNILLSLWWGKKFGLSGIFAATGVSRLFTTTIVDPWLVYKNNFSQKPFEYYWKYIAETIAVIFNGFIQYKLISVIHIDGWHGFVIKVLILTISINVVFILEFFWTKEFKTLFKRFKTNFRRV